MGKCRPDVAVKAPPLRGTSHPAEASTEQLNIVKLHIIYSACFSGWQQQTRFGNAVALLAPRTPPLPRAGAR